jgi:hypothetical protein
MALSLTHTLLCEPRVILPLTHTRLSHTLFFFLCTAWSSLSLPSRVIVALTHTRLSHTHTLSHSHTPPPLSLSLRGTPIQHSLRFSLTHTFLFFVYCMVLSLSPLGCDRRAHTHAALTHTHPFSLTHASSSLSLPAGYSDTALSPFLSHTHTPLPRLLSPRGTPPHAFRDQEDALGTRPEKEKE